MSKDSFLSSERYKRVGASAGASKSSTDAIDLYSLDKEAFLKLCELFPRSAKCLQQYCIAQSEHLSQVRQRMQHLHHANFVKKFYRKNQIFLDRKADVASGLALEIKRFTADQCQSEIDKIVAGIESQVDAIEADIYRSLHQ